MIRLQCTGHLLKRMHVQPVSMTCASTSRLGDWHANVLFVGQLQMVIAINDRSLLTVVMPLKQARTLPERWRHQVIRRFVRLNLPEAVLESEVAALAEIAVTRSTSRRALGSLNEMARHCRGMIDERRVAHQHELEDMFDRIPCGAIAYATPADETRRILGLPHRDSGGTDVPAR